MATLTSEGSQYLQRLLRHAVATPAVAAAFVGGPSAGGGSDPFAELHVSLVAEPSFAAGLVSWIEPLGETAVAESDSRGCRIVTVDGLLLVVTVGETVPAGSQVIFDRRPSPTVSAQPAGTEIEVGRFWLHLYQALAAIGREQPLAAHGQLEDCRVILLDPYRMALAPGRSTTGWEGADTLPGGTALLDGLRPWLVAPLAVQEQWRCAHRLATTYESLVLPLVERLKLPYPWALRNLAFGRLDAVRPTYGGEPDVAARRQQEADARPKESLPAAEPVREGAAKFRIKSRRTQP